MNTKHRWYDVIMAWASGENIQYRTVIRYSADIVSQSEWEDYTDNSTPAFNVSNVHWRIKPKTCTRRYRMAKLLDERGKEAVVAVNVGKFNSCAIEGFIQWVGDIVEIEVEE